MEKELYPCLNHSYSLWPEDGNGINKIQRRHISNQDPLDGVVDCAVCSSSTNTCTAQENNVSGIST